MRILYAIQGTGNGHLSRARDIVPLLHKKGELDILISGTQADIDIPYPIKYRFKGLGFIFGKDGGIDLMQTYRKSNLYRLLIEINSVPVEDYDIVISDFDPVSSWACYVKNKKCISLSHQAAVLSKNAPQPKRQDMLGKAILKYYAPFTVSYGFHFKAYDQNIFTPVIRRQIRELQPLDKGHYTVYLPAYDDKRILKILSQCGDTNWQVFSKHNKKAFVTNNISVFPVSNEAFIHSMAGATGILCGAGFETPAEALFLGKKLMVIPMKNQYEQHCNAAALKAMGVPVLKNLKIKQIDKIRSWIVSGSKLLINYQDTTSQILDQILQVHAMENNQAVGLSDLHVQFSMKEFRKKSLKKILAYVAK